MELFALENLNFAYTKHDCVLREVSLRIREGEVLLLLGASGSGKTTLLKQLKPQLTPSGYRSGTVSYCGMPLMQVPARQSALEIGYVFQDPEHQIVTDKVWHELAFGLENQGLNQRDMELAIGEVVNYFGMQDWFEQRTDTLSGGQKQILNLASILVMHPKVLLLDEPTSQLDPIAAQRFLQMLEHIKQELGIAIVISEHRVDAVYSLADRIAVLDQGSLTYVGDTRKGALHLLRQDRPEMTPTASQAAYGLLQREAAELPLTVGEGRQWLTKHAFSYPVSAPKPDGAKRDPHPKRETVARLRQVYFSYEREQPDVLKQFDLRLFRGECFSVLGGNGTGKTTLLRLLAGAGKPYAGKCEIAATTAYLPQNVQSLFSQETVGEELAGIDSENIRRFALSKLCDRHPYDLSAGEQQRLALLLLLQQRPEILLLDEPTKGMDQPARQALTKRLKELCQSGTSVLLVTHDVEFAAACADRCGLLFDGRLTGVASAREFFLKNQFYTTSLRRMTRGITPDAVLKEEVIGCAGADNEGADNEGADNNANNAVL